MELLTFVPSLNAVGRKALPSIRNENNTPASNAPQQTKIKAIAPFNHSEVCDIHKAPLGDTSH